MNNLKFQERMAELKGISPPSNFKQLADREESRVRALSPGIWQNTYDSQHPECLLYVLFCIEDDADIEFENENKIRFRKRPRLKQVERL